MQTIPFTESEHGYIYDMGRESWWELDDEGSRSVPKTHPSLQFASVDQIGVEGKFLRFMAWLINPTDEIIEVALFDAAGILSLKLVETDDIKERPYEGPPRPPLPPPAPPPPTVLIMPPKTMIEFMASVDLGKYDIAPGTNGEVQWEFHFWHQPHPSGKLKVHF